MRILQPVIWSKGTFLSPQHLQVQDRFIESILQFRTEALQFRPWGFSRLKIDHEALAGGSFAIHEASGIFADGLLFDIPGSDPAPAVKPLAGYFEPDQKTMLVYLAIPNHLVSGINLSIRERALDTRYLAEVASFRDENTGTAEKPVQLARKNFRLLVEGEPRGGCVSMPVARAATPCAVRYRADGSQVRTAAARFFRQRISRIHRPALSRNPLGQERHPGRHAPSEKSEPARSSPRLTSRISGLLYTINLHFPEFRHLLFETRHGHPEALFSSMLALASTLTTFSLQIQPRDLPIYDHEQLGECFAELDEKLRHLLETVIPSNFVSLPLKPIRPSIYAASIFEDRFLENTRMYLAVQAEMNEADLIEKAPQLIKVCSASHVEHLIRQAAARLATHPRDVATDHHPHQS